MRDVAYDRSVGLAASVSVNWHLSVWDPVAIASVRDVEICPSKSQEIACLAMQENLVAIGSEGHISLVDARCKDTKHIPFGSLGPFSEYEGRCIRSISFREDILTACAGGGKIKFFDLRADAFLEVPASEGQAATMGDPTFHLQTSQGLWHPRDMQFFRDFHLHQDEFLPSCYTHSWDPSGLRLFVGGGPTYFVARGIYAAVWS